MKTFNLYVTRQRSSKGTKKSINPIHSRPEPEVTIEVNERATLSREI